MNNIIKLIFTFLLVGVFVSCEKKISEITFDGGTAPVLSANKSGAITLGFATQNEEAVRLMWTNPDYQLSTGNSSHNVSYQLEVDTTGSNFTNPKKKTVSFSGSLEKSITQAELNDYILNGLELAAGMPHNIEMRISSFIGNNTGKLTSNVLKLTVTPYTVPPKVTLPFTGRLFLIGSATPGGDATGWNNPVPVPSQEFTQVTPTLYEITIPLNGGKEYLMIPENGSWSNKYAVDDNSVAGIDQGGEFGYNLGANFKGPAASGTYKITVNFQTGKFSVVKQ